MTTTIDPVAIGDVVFYVDEHARRHRALVVAVHGVFGTNRELWEKNGNSPEQIEEWIAANPHLDPDGQAATPSLNVVYVSDDETKTDQYGRQIERHATSVVHHSSQAAAGRYWENL